jgi:NitT/TauT family transport system substrate-binding protein
MKKGTMVISAIVVAVGLAGCSGGTTAESDTSTAAGSAAAATEAASSAAAPASPMEAQDVSILMNWFGSPEQGGYWQADATDLGADAGVNITVKPGGPGIQTIPQVAAGEATFGIGNADEIMVARQNGLPIVAVAASMNLNPQCMMSHKEANIAAFPDVNGKTVSRVPSPYWDYLKKTFALDSVQEVNITGLADFKQNKDMVLQCYETGEPYWADQEGIDVNILSNARDGGYNPYPAMLFTSEQQINENPEMVRAVVAAVTQGWADFMADPAAAKEVIMAGNDQFDDASFTYAWQTMTDKDYVVAPIGAMADDRLTELRDQLASVGLVPADFDYTKAFDSQFLPQG